MLDAGMAVGPQVFEEYARLNRALVHFVYLDPTGRTGPPHRVSFAVVASRCDCWINR